MRGAARRPARGRGHRDDPAHAALNRSPSLDRPVLLRLREAVAAPGVALRETAANRGLLALQLSWAAVNLATWTATVALTVAAFELGGPGAVATVVVVRSLPSALVGPLLAAATTTWPWRRALAASAAAMAVLAAAGAASARSLVSLAALGLAVTAVSMVFRARQSAAVPDLATGPRQVASSNVLTGGTEALGVFGGPALATLGLTLGGPPLAFGLAAGTAALGALLLLLAPGRRHGDPSAAAGSAPGREGRRGHAALARQGAARLLLGLVLAQTVVSGGLIVLYPSLAADVYGWGAEAAGTLTAAFGLGGVVGSVGLFALAGSRRLGAATAVALLLWAVPLAALAAVRRPEVALALLAVIGVGNVLFDMTTVTLLQRAVPPPLLGRAFAALEVAVVLGVASGAALAGPLAAAAGPAATLLVLALPLGLVALAGVPALRRLDRTLSAPREQVALLRAQPAFALLPTPEVERLALHLRRVALEEEETVVLQGEHAATYWLVQSGRLGVWVDGRRVSELTPPDAFGEIALLHAIRRTATVRTLAPTVLWALDREPFLDALQHGGARDLLGRSADARLARAAPARGSSASAVGSCSEPRVPGG